MLNILIKGCGIAALVAAWELKKHDCNITITSPSCSPEGSASWFAGGMLAPFCERESAEPIVEQEGIKALAWWRSNFSDFITNKGTLVLSTDRDKTEITRFANATNNHKKLANNEIAELEPTLADRFNQGLFYQDEAHINPREILLFMRDTLEQQGVKFIPCEPNHFANNKPSNTTLVTFNSKTELDLSQYNFIIDCTGQAQIATNKYLRGVRGEMLLVKCHDLNLTRTIRLLHPRIPLYIVPRGNNMYMIGSTMIESDSMEPITARSMMEFLNAAYTIHPAFANAQILEASVGVRPAFSDNLPKIYHDKENAKIIYINGFYRHGYLLSPYIAQKLLTMVL